MTSKKRAQNPILMTRHYTDLGIASDWWNRISYAARPIRSTSQIWVVTRHQYGISALVSQTSFGGETGVTSPNVGCFLRLIICIWEGNLSVSEDYYEASKEHNLWVKITNFSTWWQWKKMQALTGISPGHLFFWQLLIIHLVIRRSKVSAWDRLLYLLNVLC